MKNANPFSISALHNLSNNLKKVQFELDFLFALSSQNFEISQNSNSSNVKNHLKILRLIFTLVKMCFSLKTLFLNNQG
jgi:hypothetical protein